MSLEHSPARKTSGRPLGSRTQTPQPIDPETLKKPLKTRRESVAYLRSRGWPLTESTFNKICAAGKGPVPDAYWGPRELHKDATLDAWAEDWSRQSAKRHAAEPPVAAPIAAAPVESAPPADRSDEDSAATA
jgi:hypothetical protein